MARIAPDVVAPALLFYGGFPLGYHNREAERKALAFAAGGYDVLYVRGVGVRDPRLRTVVKAVGLVVEGLRRPAPAPELHPEASAAGLKAAGLLVVPPRRMRTVRRLNGRWLERQLRRHVPDPAQSVAWIRSPTPELVDVLPRLSPAVTVYECVDAVDLIPELAESSWLTTFQAAERRLAEVADAVVTPSPALAERFREVAREVHVVPHGADLFPWHPRSHEPGQPVVLGFIGSLDFRIDMQVLRALATARPAWHIRLMGVVGPGFDPAPVRGLPNVTIEPRVDPQQLGEVLASFDVGLMPYIDYPGYHYSNAVKNLELLAAGRPAVARPAPALDAFADALYFARTPGEFIAQCERALAEDSLDRAHARRAIAERHTWDDRLLSVAALGAGPTQVARVCLAGLLLWAGRSRRGGGRPIRLVLEYRRVRFPCVVSELRDLHLLRHVFVTEQYRLDSHLHPEIIFDAGSNSGLAVLYFRIVYPGARIVALEPDPVAFRRLQMNTERWPGIVLRNVALAATEGPRVFYRSAETWTSSLLASDSWTSTDDVTPVDQVAIEVQVMTLESLMVEQDVGHVDLLKLDVEGAEWEILPTLRGADRVTAIVGELHWDVDQAPCDRDVGELLRDYEVRLRDVSRHRSDFWAVRSPGSPPGTSPPPR